MEFIRDLIRDLVGIIFPGSFLVFTALCFLLSILFLFYPVKSVSETLTLINSSGAFFIFLVFSYIAGQSLRLKQLGDVEKRCTELYRKNLNKRGISEDDYEKSVILVREEEEAYSKRKSTREKLTKALDKHIDRFGLWEEFPYPMYVKWRRLRAGTKNFNDYIEKYEKQGVSAKHGFFGFCQMVVYEYSASLKEELLRQEALIRLFAGLFYALIFGRIASVITIFLHSVALVLFQENSFLLYLQEKNNARISLAIIIVSFLAFLVFEYFSREILKRLRPMRVKEVRMVYDSFYLVSTKHNLDT